MSNTVWHSMHINATSKNANANVNHNVHLVDSTVEKGTGKIEGLLGAD